MSQGIFSSIVPSTTSGNQLATILNDFKDAVVSGFSGTSRPSALQAGGYWIDTTNNPTTWDYKFYTGTLDITVFTLNLTTGVASIASADSLFEIAKISADSLGPILKLLKERVANNGQTLDGDSIGEIHFYGTRDSGTNVAQARIKAVSSDDVTASAQGGYLVFEVTSDATASMQEVMRLVDGKLGLGTLVPDTKLHVKGDIKAEYEADDAVGPKVVAKKKRVAGSGQVLSGDVIGEVDFHSTDASGGNIEAAKLVVSANENHSVTAQGTKVSVSNKKVGQTTFTEHISIEDDVTVKTNLIVDGNLTVSGTTTTINTTNLEVEDANISVNKGGTQASANASKSGFKVEMSDATHAQVGYDSTKASKFVAGEVGTEAEVVTVSHTQTLTNKTLTSPLGIVKADVGLSNVDNTSDATKFTNTPLTGVPTAPTATNGTNTTQLATTAFVQDAIAPFDGVEPLMRANSSSGQVIGVSGTTMIFETEIEDPDSAYDHTTGIYTAPSGEAGVYLVNTRIATANFTPASGATSLVVSIQKNGVTVSQAVTRTGGTTNTAYGVRDCTLVRLAVGDTVKIVASCSVATTMNTGGVSNEFSLVKVSL